MHYYTTKCFCKCYLQRCVRVGQTIVGNGTFGRYVKCISYRKISYIWFHILWGRKIANYGTTIIRLVCVVIWLMNVHMDGRLWNSSPDFHPYGEKSSVKIQQLISIHKNGNPLLNFAIFCLYGWKTAYAIVHPYGQYRWKITPTIVWHSSHVKRTLNVSFLSLCK